jgi:nitroimidazol reductase NimA-like FMN-containing flavoprotein (pyridoxamine 5'-phosphate oxidase superfamily)
MSNDMLDRMKALVLSKDSCVLATSAGDKPHCSLMVYVADDQCREIFMVTHRKGTKYANLKQNPNVSLLIDTREEHQGENRPKALALTVNGTFTEIEDPRQITAVGEQLMNRHPHMADFMSDDQVAVFAVKVGSFLLLDGLTQSHFRTLDDL